MTGENIIRQLKIWRAAFAALRLAGALVDCAAAAAWLMAAALGACALLILSPEQRAVLAAGSAVYLAYRFYNGFIKGLSELRLKKFASFAESNIPALARYLVSAYDLARGAQAPGASPELGARHLEMTEGLLRATGWPEFLSLKTIFKPQRIYKLVSGICAAGLLAFMAPHALRALKAPFTRVPLEDIMAISPGDASVIKGDTFKLEASFGHASEEEPELFLKYPGAGYIRAFMTASGPGRFEYSGRELEQDVYYRFRYKGLESRTYTLKVLPVPELKNISFKITRPQYAGGGKKLFEYFPSEAAALTGSVVSVSARGSGGLAEGRIKISGGDGASMKPAADGAMQAEFPVFEDISYTVDLIPADGGSVRSYGPYAIKVSEDASPVMTVFSPAFALDAGTDEDVRAVYEARDDIGLGHIMLARQVTADGRAAGELGFEEKIRTFSGLEDRSFSGEVQLPIYDLPNGAVAEFKLIACDKAPGLNCSESAPISVRAVDLAGAHARVYNGLEELKSRMETLSAQQAAALKKLREQGGDVPAPELEKQAADWRNTSELAGDIAELMKQDPYLSGATRERYDLLRNELGHSAGKVSKLAALPEPVMDHAAARSELKKSLDSGVKELEKILRYEGARTGEFGFENMAQNASSMAEALAGGEQATSRDWERFARALEKIRTELERIRSMLKDRPPVSKDGEKVFALPADSALKAANELARAVRDRDAASAAALAAKLAEELSRMRRVMEEYSQHEASAGFSDGRREELNALAALWKALYEAQSAETESGKRLEVEMFAKTEKARGALLAELEIMQSSVTSIIGAFRQYEPAAYASAVAAENYIKKRDMAAAEAAIGQLTAQIEKSTCQACAGALSGASAKEKKAVKILSRLDRDSELLETSDLPRFEAAAAAQGSVRSRTYDLKGRVTKEYTGALADKLADQLDAAGGYMQKAVEAFKVLDARSAAVDQVRALEELESGQSSLEDAMEKLQKMAGQGEGGGRPSGVFMRTAGGIDRSPVKLPGAQDYVPPAELRRKVMDSLNEPYPRANKDMIERYLKSISK